MVKIPLIYEESEKEKRIYAPTSFIADGLRKGAIHIRFIVDTGSPVTLISYGESLRLQIPQRILEFKENMALGGTTYKRMMFKRAATIYFKTYLEEAYKIQFKGYGIAMPKENNPEALSRAMTLPCIIGLDFLKDNKLRLICSPHEKVAFFETVPDSNI